MFDFSVFVRVQRGCVPLQNRERDGLDTKGLANLFPDGLTEAAAWSILLSLCTYGAFLILGYYQSNHGICGGPYRDGIPPDFPVAQNGESRESSTLGRLLQFSTPNSLNLSEFDCHQVVDHSENSSPHGNMTNSLQASDGMPLITGIADLLYAGLHNFLSGGGSCFDEVTSLMNPCRIDKRTIA